MVETDWLPRAELERLLAADVAGFPGLALEGAADAPGGHRGGPDPVLVSTVVTGVTTLLAPFVAKLVDRLFAAEPDARTSVVPGDGGPEIVLSGLPADTRVEVVSQALESGAVSLPVTLEPAPR
ncbi:hypothetical protein ACWCQL_25280 [Streptomyces sp. NPDC002073]